jgi:hypothetical protein
VIHNPVLDFGLDLSTIEYIGSGLQRPECILAEKNGNLWSADARGGVARITPDGKQQIITQQRSDHFQGTASEASRYLQGTLPNGLAFARNGDSILRRQCNRRCAFCIRPRYSSLDGERHLRRPRPANDLHRLLEGE